MPAILKVWRQIESPTPSVDVYLREEHLWQVSFRSDLKLRSRLAFLNTVYDGRPNKNNNKMSSDMGSVLDPEMWQEGE